MESKFGRKFDPAAPGPNFHAKKFDPVASGPNYFASVIA